MPPPDDVPQPPPSTVPAAVVPLNPVSGRPETDEARLDRNFAELLQELRVAQAGTQILFAFLLASAFTPYIQESGPFERRLLGVTLVVAALATGLNIAPVALHRALFRRRMKESIVDLSAYLARGGLALLLLTILGGCLLALDALLSRPFAIAVTSVVAAWCLVFWWLLPLRLRRGRPAHRPHHRRAA